MTQKVSWEQWWYRRIRAWQDGLPEGLYFIPGTRPSVYPALKLRFNKILQFVTGCAG